MIHLTKIGHYVISRQGCGWLPGCFESARAATLAFKVDALDIEALQRLQDEAIENNGGVITYQAVRDEYRRLRKCRT